MLGLSINLIEQFTKNRERDYLEIINYISELAPEILNQYVDEFNRNPEMTVDIPLLFENKTISKNIPFKKIINIIKKINNEQNNLSNKRKWVSFATYTCRIRTTEELANILQQCDYFLKPA
ncbi:MAG: hypothetical protein HWD59_14510 [Coxiellaceae bacterium]|nr:MAG: hypothetical protein HWD59_14510 [Coxiellaceae bacterium]